MDFTGESNEKLKAFAENAKDKKKKTILVMQQGGATAMGFWKKNCDAILVSFFGGEQWAPATFNILYGYTNPSGKLPVSMPETDKDQVLTPEQYPGVNNVSVYSEGLQIGYRMYDMQNKTPAYPFGYGLSYTNFQYDASTFKMNNQTISMNVTNTGHLFGKEVV